MRILQVGTNENGCWWYRNHLPSEFLRSRGHEVTFIAGQGESIDLAAYDVFVFSRLSSDEVSDFVEEIKRAGKKIVYEVDDAMDIVPQSSPYHTKTEKHLPSFFYFLQNADAITVTTDALARHVRRYTKKPVFVLPNCYDGDHWSAPIPPKDDTRYRVAFAGSVSHLSEIGPAIEGVKLLREMVDKPVEFTLFGFGRPNDTFESWCVFMRDLLKKLPPSVELKNAFDSFVKSMALIDDFRWVNAVPVRDYSRKLRTLGFDVGIAPLDATPFNEYKSNIKYVEYTLSGAVTVASNPIGKDYPYSRSRAVFVERNEPRLWAHALKSVLTDEELYKSLRDAALIDVYSNNDINVEGRRWETVLKSLCE